MPNLENLRKQAKQILRWHQSRHFPVAAIVREHLPAFAEMTDGQILDRPFRLADAQELVARRLGFRDWETMRANIEERPKPGRPSEAGPKLLQAEPQIFVSDVNAATHHFSERLGFSVVFAYGEPPFYAQVARDGVALNLRLVHEPVIGAERAAREDLLSASITVDSVKALFLEYQASGADFHQALRTEPWGARTFIVRDPDGNLILFAGSGEK